MIDKCLVREFVKAHYVWVIVVLPNLLLLPFVPKLIEILKSFLPALVEELTHERVFTNQI